MRTIIAQPARPQVQACRPQVSTCGVSPRLAPIVARRDVSVQAGGRAKTTEETGPFLQKENSGGDQIREGFDKMVESVQGDKNYKQTGSGKDYAKNYEKAADKQEELKDLRQDLYGNAGTKAQATTEKATADVKAETEKTAKKTGNAVEKGVDAVKGKAAEVAESVKNVAR